MNLNSINKELLIDTINDEHEAGTKYLKYAKEIESLCDDPLKLYSNLEFPDEEKDYNSFTQKVYLSSIMSDISKITPSSKFAVYYGDNRYNKYEVEELLKHHKLINNSNDIQSVTEGYFTFSDYEAEFLQSNFEPLFEMGQLTLSPKPNLMAIVGEKENPNFYTIPAEFDIEEQKWRAPLYNGNQRDIPIRNQDTSNDTQSTIIEEIMIPFISGISAKDFSLILRDEADLISSFRSDLLKITNSNTHQEGREIYQDLIRPRIDKINQKFKSISELHSFKMKGVTVFTAALSLLSLSAGDYMGATSIMVGVGTGTAGLIKFEADYHSEINNLKNDSMYLLWKLNNLSKK
ncbi:hypothetical protein [Chryseobacterium sp. Mn2064]|uniref:hypothetical protein n=1 Tax=Chryseobacterium sp. Mn2064 TaxID=3395263 RepID=UPI003BDD3CFD